MDDLSDALSEWATISDNLGIHTRPTATLMKLAATFDADVYLAREETNYLSPDGVIVSLNDGSYEVLGIFVGGKLQACFISLLTWALENGSRVRVLTRGKQAHEALDAMVNCLGGEF